MAIKPDFHILAKDCEDGSLDWKYHIYKSEKDAREFADKLDGEWRIFKLEPVEIIDECYDIYYLDDLFSQLESSGIDTSKIKVIDDE